MSENSTSKKNIRSRFSGRDFPLWIGLVVFIVIIFIYVVLTNPKYQETLNIMVFGRPTANATEGILLSIRITLTAFAISLVIGLLTGLGRTSNNMLYYNIATFYVEVVRGIPLVVLMLYVAFVLLPVVINGLTALGDNTGLVFLQNVSIRDVSFEVRAIVALAFGYGAYEAEVFRAGIESIERGQMEAARSLGMTYVQGYALCHPAAGSTACTAPTGQRLHLYA